MAGFLHKHRALRGAMLLAQRYFDHHVARDSAALTYYLLFAIFPLLIFLSNVVGTMQLDVTELMGELKPFVPNNVLALLNQYFTYVSRDSSRTLLGFSLVFSIYFPFRAANSLMASVRKAYGLPLPTKFLLYQLRVMLYTIVLIVTLALSIFLSTVSGQVLNFIARFIYLSDEFITLWGNLRFVLLGVILFFLIAFLYALAQERRTFNHIWPGVLTSLITWLLFSVLYSLYVENVARYSVIYGSIGTIIVLLLWLYLASVMLIMGAEFNSVLLETEKQQEQ